MFPISGYLIEVVEFLAPPQTLIGSCCNSAGYTKKECKETVDKCRRRDANKLQDDHM